MKGIDHALGPNAVINRMAFMVGSKADDTNADGMPDQIPVTVALFSSPNPYAIQMNGAFTFALYKAGQYQQTKTKPLGEWKIGPHIVPNSLATAQYGPCYRFRLNLMDIDADVSHVDRVDIACRFYPADGSPVVYSDGARTIQMGSQLELSGELGIRDSNPD